MGSPTVTSLSYPGRGGNMEIRTPGVPGSGGSGPIDMDALYRMFQYKASTKAWEAQRQAALAEREMKMREQMQQAQLDAMTRAAQPQERQPVHAAAPQAEAMLAMAKPKDFGEMRADRYGNWGTFVDPANIPAALQGTIMGGQYGDISNWDSSNPMITGPQQAIAKKYQY